MSSEKIFRQLCICINPKPSTSTGRVWYPHGWMVGVQKESSRIASKRACGPKNPLATTRRKFLAGKNQQSTGKTIKFCIKFACSTYRGHQQHWNWTLFAIMYVLQHSPQGNGGARGGIKFNLELLGAVSAPGGLKWTPVDTWKFAETQVSHSLNVQASYQLCSQVLVGGLTESALLSVSGKKGKPRRKSTIDGPRT